MCGRFTRNYTWARFMRCTEVHETDAYADKHKGQCESPIDARLVSLLGFGQHLLLFWIEHFVPPFPLFDKARQRPTVAATDYRCESAVPSNRWMTKA